VPDVELNWTDPEVDVGSVDIVVPPYREAPDLTAPLTAPVVNYNDLPLMLSAMLGDDVDPTGAGTGQTWVHQPASLTADDIDIFSYRFGDDRNDDWYEFGDGLLESLTFNFPESMGPVTADMAWRFGMARYAGATETDLQPEMTTPTAGLTADNAAIPVYFGDAVLYIDSAFGDMGTTPISNALHAGSLSISQALDLKRFAQGNGFDLAAYGRGARLMELDLQFAKTDDTVGVGSESDAWFSETAINRFVQLEFTSSAVAETGSPDVPYSWTLEMPMRYYTRAEGNIGGNTTINLKGRLFYNADLLFPFKSTVVNTLATASL
jgi:hypothetical protein